MKVHRRLRRAGRAGREAQQRDIVPPVRTASKVTGLLSAARSSSASWLAVPSKPTTLLRKRLSFAQATSSSRMRLSHSASLISALSTTFVSSCARSIGMVLTTTAPALVAASQHAIIAGLFAERISTRLPRFHAVIFHERPGEPVAPVGKFLVGAAPAVPDERGAVAEAALDQAIGQFDRRIEIFGVVEPFEPKVRPLLRRRQMVARERIDMSGGTEHRFVSFVVHECSPSGVQWWLTAARGVVGGARADPTRRGHPRLQILSGYITLLSNPARRAAAFRPSYAVSRRHRGRACPRAGR